MQGRRSTPADRTSRRSRRRITAWSLPLTPGRAAAGTRSVATVNQYFDAERATLLRLVAADQIVGEEAEALVGYAVDALAETGLVTPCAGRA